MSGLRESTVPRPIGFRKTRLETLQDGIFAVALTLLAIDLRVPAGLSLPEARAHLMSLLPSLGVYAVTFAFIVVVWLFVYSFQEVIARQDIIGATLALSATAGVALLPFTSSTFARYPDGLMTGHFFLFNLIAIVAIYIAYNAYAIWKLVPRTVDRRLLRTYSRIIWLAEIYIIIVDIAVVPYRPTWILAAVSAGFVYAYACLLVLHPRFVMEHDRVYEQRSRSLSDPCLPGRKTWIRS
jgi:uncharacterized membrane protein